MNTYINYERIEKNIDKTTNELSELFRKIIQEGSDIIYYHEEKGDLPNIITVVIITGRKRTIRL
jgi:hypothetical protein